MHRPFPPQAAAPLTLIQTHERGRRPPRGVQPGLVWLTDPGSTIEMALATRRPHSSDGEIVVVAVAGELDAASAPRLSAFIDGVYFPYEAVRLDLGRTTFADGALLRVLDTERARRVTHRVEIEIIRASPAVRRVLEAACQLRYLSAR